MSFKTFLHTLPIMGKGMLGIFGVILVIYLTVWTLNRVTGTKKSK